MKIQPCSILLPIFNGSQFLKQSIDSNLKTMRIEDELVIVNDGSTDTTTKDLTDWERYDSRIRVVNRKHFGLVNSLNFGISICSNEYIARADIDDIYRPDRIIKQVSYLESNPNCGAVFSDYEIKTIKGKSLGIIPTAISSALTRFSLLNSVRTAHPSVMFRKSAVIAAGEYIDSDFPTEDLSLWIRLSNICQIGTIPEILLFFTQHTNSVTNNSQLLMKNKTRKLISNFVENIDINDVLNDADSMLQIYDKFSEPTARKLLFFRDLFKYAKLTGIAELNQIPKYLVRYRNAINLNTIPVLINMKKDQYLRHSLRDI